MSREEIIELYKKLGSKRAVAKILVEKGLYVNEESARSFVRGATKSVVEETLESKNMLPNWKSAWVKTKDASVYVRNDETVNWEEEIPRIIEPLIKPVDVRPRTIDSDRFDRVVITDAHIGMNPDSRGVAIYPTTWSAEDIEKSVYSVLDTVNIYKSGSRIFVDSLGDMLDGYDGKTTRGGHALPQNMSTLEAFECVIKFYALLVGGLANEYSEIQLNCVTNDNHSGSFGEIANKAIQMMLEGMYKNVKVNIHRKFISHYTVGNHVFILCHGKDNSQMKFGLKPKLDEKTAQKIESYIRHYKLEGKIIEFSKGDSHQYMTDLATSEVFDFVSYPALSPSSEWVQTNFKKGRRGFLFYSIDYLENSKLTLPVFL